MITAIFAAQSNFIIYYNVFRDEFFGEAKIHRIPEITYEFDSSELKDLRLKLEEKLGKYAETASSTNLKFYNFIKERNLWILH